mgnify:FL=1
MSTALQLITAAYYASGVVSRDFSTVTGSQAADGLMWLNDILGQKRVDGGMIPYETTYTFVAKPNVEKYFIPGLIKIDTLVFYLDQVRYAMNYSQRNAYFGSARAENISSLPTSWYFEKQVGGGNLYIYFKPNQQYPMEIHGSFDIPEITSLQQDLSSNVTIADVGKPNFLNSNFGYLLPGQLVVNQVDLYGSYANIGALKNKINSGIIPGVKADIVVNNLVLSSTTHPPVPIYISTSGYENGTKQIGNVKAIEMSNLDATYAFGNNGIGATLTCNNLSSLVVDGYTVNLGDRILINGQTFEGFNGCYELTFLANGVSPWVLTRTTNYDQSVEVGNGDVFKVENGNVFEGYSFIQEREVQEIGLSSIKFKSIDSITFSNFSTIETSNYEIFNALGFDKFYITYLRYALSERICAENNLDTPQNVSKQLAIYEDMIDKKSKVLDLSLQKSSTLQRRGSFNYAFVNLGRGWTPS